MKLSWFIAILVILFIVLQFGHFVIWVPLKIMIIGAAVALIIYKFKKR